MSVITFEGIVENGRIRLREPLTLPDQTKVYVVVPDVQAPPKPRIASPRLADPARAGEFAKQVSEVPPDANL